MTLSPRERRFVILAGIAVVAFLAVNFAILPAISRQQEVRAGLQEKQQALERYQLIMEGRRRYERRLTDAQQLVTQLEQLLLPGEKLTLASAELQAMLHKAAGESGVTIVSENIHAPKKAEGFTQVTVELTMNADLKKLRDFLYKIEGSRKLLTVPKLLLNANFPRPGAELQVTVAISGYTKGSEEKT
jgi:type II secretory pathway component PulM